MTKKTTYVFVFLLFALSVMGVARYVFVWGEPITSPQYIPVPQGYFWAYRVLTTLFVVLILMQVRKFNLRLLLVNLSFTALVIVSLLQTSNFHVRGAGRAMIFCSWIFSFLYSNNAWLDLRSINKLIELLGWTIVIFIIYQIVNYHMYGVLPSHSHVGKLIRYGSIYDDSLVLGVLLPMYVGFFLEKNRTNVLLEIFFALLFSVVVVLTGSFTAMAVFISYIVWRYRKEFHVLLPVVSFSMLLLLIFWNKILFYISFKMGSIVGHLVGWGEFFRLNLLSIFGVYPLNVFVESGWLLLMINYGLPVLSTVCVFHIFIFRACKRVLETQADVELVLLARATQALNFSLVLANLNLPVMVIYPAYLFLCVFSAIIISRESDMNINRIKVSL